MNSFFKVNGFRENIDEGAVLNKEEAPIEGSLVNEQDTIEGHHLRKGDAYANYEWITDEGLLRDEGVICGLAAVDVDHKIKAIDAFYQELILKNRNQRDAHNAHLKDVLIKQEPLLSRRQESMDRMQNLEKLYHDGQGFRIIRLGVGLLLSLGICSVQFTLIYDLLQPFTDVPLIYALGIFFPGMFGQYTFISFFFTDQQQPEDEGHAQWKRMLLEIGMPVIASLLLCGLIYPGTAAFLLVIYFLFFTLVFLFAGKMVLSNLAVFQRRWHEHAEHKAFRKHLKKQMEDLKKEMESIGESMVSLEGQMVSLQSELDSLEPEAAIRAKNDMSREIFLSEYTLARDYRFKTNSSADKVI